MKVVFHYPLEKFRKSNPRALPCLDALWKGFKKRGIKPSGIDQPQYEPCDIAVMVGMYKRRFPITHCRQNIIERQLEHGGRTIVIERGWILRDRYESIGFDDINGRADFCLPHLDGSRWESMGVELQETGQGGVVLVIGQIPWDTSCQHIHQERWVRAQVKLWKSLEEFVVFRPHPLSSGSIRDTGADEVSTRPLVVDLDRAKFVVTFNSTVGVDAVLAGRKVIADDIGSMAYSIQGDEDRWSWAVHLAHCQWTLDEMRSGAALEHLLEGVAA